MFDIDQLILGPLAGVFDAPAVLTRARDLTTVPITGVFDEAYLPVEAMGADLGIDSMHITTAGPVLGVRLSTIPGAPPRQADQVLVRGRTYSIKEVQPDGHGWALLILNRASLEP